MRNRGNIIFVFSILTLLLLINTKTYSTTSINTCFSDSGADFIKAETEGHVFIGTDDTPETAADKIMNGFDRKEHIKDYYENDMYIVEFSSNDMEVLIRSKEVEVKKKIYVSVAVSQYKDSVNINNVWRTAQKAFSVYNVQPSCSSLISGKFDSKLSEKGMEKIVRNIFSKNNIRYIDKMSDKNLISVCGYMPGINEYITDNKKRININIALRYSETFSCTYISIGSPVITVEY